MICLIQFTEIPRVFEGLPRLAEIKSGKPYSRLVVRAASIVDQTIESYESLRRALQLSSLTTCFFVLGSPPDPKTSGLSNNTQVLLYHAFVGSGSYCPFHESSSGCGETSGAAMGSAGRMASKSATFSLRVSGFLRTVSFNIDCLR